MSIYRVADTVADSVRIAVQEGVGDYWRNKLEAGKLKSAMVRNDILAQPYAERRADDLTMCALVRFGGLS